MSRRRRTRERAADYDRLEARWMLDAAAASLVPGNGGYIRRSQFQSTPFGEVANQWWQLEVGGPVTVHVDPPLRGAGASAPGIYTPPASIGNVISSQFNSTGFSLVGTQLRQVRLGGGLSVDVHDESLARRASGSSSGPGGGVGIVGAATNSGDIVRAQFNDSGFGNIGLQGRRVRVGGDLAIRTQTFLRPPIITGDVSAAGRTHAQADAAAAAAGDSVRPQASGNTNLIRDTQYNDGAWGKVGLQLRQVRVGRSAGVAMESWLVQDPDTPEDDGRPAPGSRAQRRSPPPTEVDATNAGHMIRSQFSDGGFGDIGFQWSRVNVGRDLSTSTNTLSIQPKTDHTAPIDAGDLVFGRGHPAATTAAPMQAQAQPTGAKLAARGRTQSAAPVSAAAAAPQGDLNEATNSGLILHSQVSDGGFGDIGLQWRRVRVGGAVSAVHNSLSVQPENNGQGFINVHDVTFPSDPAPLPAPHPGPRRVIDPTPPLIERDGQPVTTPLPKRTRPFDKTFQTNTATNSGDIRGSQFSDGGFGDIGLQWQDTSVGGNVRLIHNSLSVHPEGSDLEGIRVSNVTFGTPLAAGQSPAIGAAGAVSVVRATAAGPADPKDCHDRTGPVNDRLLLYKQFTDSTEADIFLQWNRVTRRFGLVVVNNRVQVDPDANITLEDIHFPGKDVPPVLGATSTGTSTPAAAIAAQEVINSATNSGIIAHNQFSDGGFGDIGVQWRKVKVGGPVTVVHNTLAVDVIGSRTGPVTIENVTYNSGALGSGSSLLPANAIVAPPPVLSRIGQRAGRSLPLPHDPDVVDHSTNSGILIGGQFAAGCLGHIGIQWRHVRIRGPVTVIDNVLSVEAETSDAGPITIKHVNFQ